MKAEEARGIARDKNESKRQNGIQEIEKMILAAATDGKFSFNYYDSISPDLRIYFENLGYFIDLKQTGPNEDCYEISWQ